MSTRHQNLSQLIKDQSLKEQIEKKPFRRKVDPLNNSLDFQTALLAGFGFSSTYIKSKTGFSGGQVYYRLRKAGVKISDYRNGQGVVAQRIYRAHREECEPALRKHIAAVLKEHASH